MASAKYLCIGRLKQTRVRYKICDELFISYLRVLLCIFPQKGVPLLYVAPLWLLLISLMQRLLYMHFKTECRISFVHSAHKQPNTRTINCHFEYLYNPVFHYKQL